MPIESPNPGRLILFGNEARLLASRAMVLRSTGMTADVAGDMEEFKLRIGNSGLDYDVAVCCYTATDAQRREIIALSKEAGTNVLNLEHFLLPPEFIERVYDLVKERRSELRGREHGKSR